MQDVAADALRPETFEEFVGQTALKRQLSVMISSAHKRKQALDHVFLSGPPGFGKTSLAGVIAEAMWDPIVCFRLPIKVSVLERAVQSWDGGILFLDEIHMASEPLQTALLTALEDKYIQTTSGRKIPLPWLTVIGATTEPERVVRPLLERFTCRPMLEDYSLDEMAKIVRQMMRKVNMPVTDELAIPLAEAAAGIPRTAKRLVEGARDLWLDEEEMPEVAAVLQMRQVAADGLTAEHEHYLKCLHTIGGQAGLATLTTILRLNEQSVRELERLLLNRQLIELTAQGRVITGKGAARSGHGRHEERQAS